MPDHQHTPRIPDIPGYPPPHREQEQWLRDVVAKLCGLEHQRSVAKLLFGSGKSNIHYRSLIGLFCGVNRFPGSQPVSFGAKDLAKLESQECVVVFVRFVAYWALNSSACVVSG